MFACSPRQDSKSQTSISYVSPKIDSTSQEDKVSDLELVETFSDSISIGEKGKCKIELIKHRIYNDTYVIVKFYVRGGDGWWHQNTYQYECDVPMDLMPNISDFNNDGFKDITFISANAARGANEVRRLFIYDDTEKELISILNSQDYPNMLYNPELDCVDAFLVHGGCTTVFANIDGDSLYTFASVNSDDFRTVYEYDENGNEKEISKEKIQRGENVYVRYSNYKPLKIFKERS